MNTEITRRFEFDAAHRVYGHEGKCANLHGHRYVALVTVLAPRLDELGRVVDFSILKEVIGKWIDENWDHNILLNSEDPMGQVIWEHTRKEIRLLDSKSLILKNPFFFIDENPTAENIAAYLLNKCKILLEKYTTIKPVRVEVYETPNCSATVRAEE